MALLKSFCLLMLATLTMGQRPPFAGSRPIGFPELLNRTTTTQDPLSDRFGEDGTTERLPIEALGDRDLIERISKMPIDQQPFWYLNWKALEAQRKNPQTYEHRPSSFAESIPSAPNTNPPSGGNVPTSGVFNRNAETSPDATRLGNRSGGETNKIKNQASNIKIKEQPDRRYHDILPYF